MNKKYSIVIFKHNKNTIDLSYTQMDIKKYLGNDNRTIKARKNIIASTFLKGIDLVVYLLLVPITLGYLNSYEYGIWLTLNSILMWINSFDIGFGNGMRNKLVIALANNNRKEGCIYVSTTFFMLVGIMGILILICLILKPYINWYTILGTNISKVNNLNEIVFTSFMIFCINFIFKIIGNVYMALQLPAINNLITVSGHLLSLIIISLLTIYTSGNLYYVAIAYTCSPLIIYLLFYPLTFWKKYRFLNPSIKMFKKSYLKDLLGVGGKFFLLQISGILLFSMTNLLISHMFGPEKVTPYNIAYRYFSLILVVMNIILSPMWSATTDAYSRGDIIWIKKSMYNIHKCIYISCLILIFMLIISPFIYKIWVGDNVDIKFSISLLMAIYIAILQTSLSYSNFLNGLGKLYIQTINTVCVAILAYPILWILGKLFNIQGLLLGMCILNIPGLILNIIQFRKVVNFEANGLWSK